jgi:two-component system, NtrC family, nitrogen regulation sensor histidine kinase NtrY
MKLRYRFIAYLILVHVVFAIPSYFIFNNNRLLLFAIEGFYLVSLVAGTMLVRLLFKPLDLILTGSELIGEEDYISTFRKTGQKELDRLIALFNTMLTKLRNERLSTEEHHYFLQKLLTAIPSGIIILDFDGHIESMNPGAENLFGISGQQYSGKPITELPLTFAGTLESMANDESVIVPFRGNRRLKCFRSQFIDRGFPRSFILIEELTEEIRKSEKAAYDKLIRMMSHEVNNSTGAVGSLLESCTKYSGQISDIDREDFTTAVDVSITRLKNLNEFMKQYADIIRLPKPHRTETDIVDILRRCAELFRQISEKNRIAWRWTISERIPPVFCDRAQMEQVFINIFKNAVEAIGTDGTISIEANADDGTVTLVIGDSGSGITSEAREHLFSPFFSTKENGQGIGLTLILEILERHGCQFSLESGDHGMTEFTIAFGHNG